MNITLTGFMGTGKTAAGKRLARRLGWRFVDVDELIETSAKQPVAEIFTRHGEQVFRRLEQRMIRRVTKGHEQVIATGGGAFMNAGNRHLLRGVGPVICLTSSAKMILQRVGAHLSKRPLLAGSPAPLARIQTLLDQRSRAYAKADLMIDTGSLSIDEVVEQIWATIGPWISKSWQYLIKHGDKLTQRYGGKYIAVLDDHIVSVGTTQLGAYQGIPQPVPASREVGIYYIPLPEESSIAL